MPFLEPLRKIAKVFIKLDANSIVFDVIKNNSQLHEDILDLNRRGQLYDKGEDSKGTDLSSLTESGFGYSQFTIKDKKSKNLPYDKVTLFDTGDFYKSFRLIVKPTYFQITADGQKDDSNLFDDFGDDIVGLSEESLQILKGIILPLILKYIKSQIL